MRLFIILFLIVFGFSTVFPQEKEKHFQKGYTLVNSGKSSAEAVRELELAAKIDPKNPEIFYTLGEAFDALNKYDMAIESYSQALSLCINTPWMDVFEDRIYYSRGNAYFQTGRFETALSDIKNGLSINSTNSNNNIQAGYCCIYLKNYSDALKFLNITIERDPDYPPSKYELRGLTYYFMNDFTNANRDMENSISLYSESIDPYFYLMIIAFKKEKQIPENLLQRISGTIQIFSKGSWRKDKAAAEYLSGRITDERLFEFTGKDPQDIFRAEVMIAYSALFNGNKKKAKTYFQKCLESKMYYRLEYSLVKYELESL